jgi:hypothetical protein
MTIETVFRALRISGVENFFEFFFFFSVMLTKPGKISGKSVFYDAAAVARIRINLEPASFLF